MHVVNCNVSNGIRYSTDTYSVGFHTDGSRHNVARRSTTDRKSAIWAAQMAWIKEVLATLKTTPSRLALDLGLSDTTLTRWEAGKNNETLSAMTVEQISEFSGIPGPGVTGTPSAKVLQLREDGAPYRGQGDEEPYKDVVSALLAGRKNAHAWVLKSDILALAGVRAGDIMIIDQTLRPRDGDIVCAQIEFGMGAKTGFGFSRRPILLGRVSILRLFCRSQLTGPVSGLLA